MARTIGDIADELSDAAAMNGRRQFALVLDNAYLTDEMSQIEAALTFAFAFVFGIEFASRWKTNWRKPDQTYKWPAVPIGSGPGVVSIIPQARFGAYRCDFLIHWNSQKGTTGFVVIECDGHDFHERTKDQASHDKARDRFMQTSDAVVLRYPGSDIWRAPYGCALEIASTIYNKMKG